jgi:hypothetical protein
MKLIEGNGQLTATMDGHRRKGNGYMATRQADGPTAVLARARKPAAEQAEKPVETGVAVVEEMLDHGSQSLDGKRRMPENLRRYLLKVQGGKLYLPAAYRIVWFRDECPDWGVATEITEGGQEAGFATAKATIYNPEGRVIATGHKTETRQDFPAGWVEKAETGAVARALALVGFGTQFSPELDEESYSDSPVSHQPVRAGMRSPIPSREESDRAAAPLGEVWEGPGQCPKCHAPQGKRHGKPCVT